jgi:hypothetical protein
LYIEKKSGNFDWLQLLATKGIELGNEGNGLNGFSCGLGLLFRNLQMRYGRSYFQNNTTYNAFGLNLSLNQYVRAGKSGKGIISSYSIK